MGWDRLGLPNLWILLLPRELSPSVLCHSPSCYRYPYHRALTLSSTGHPIHQYIRGSEFIMPSLSTTFAVLSTLSVLFATVTALPLPDDTPITITEFPAESDSCFKKCLDTKPSFFVESFPESCYLENGGRVDCAEECLFKSVDVQDCDDPALKRIMVMVEEYTSKWWKCLRGGRCGSWILARVNTEDNTGWLWKDWTVIWRFEGKQY